MRLARLAKWGVAALCAAGLSGLASAQLPAAIQAAQDRLAVQPQAVELVWNELSAQALPIITPHPQDDSLARVTFVYRSAPDVEQVRLDSVVAAPLARQPVTDYRRDFTLPLQRLTGTPIWWIRIDVPRDVEAVYSFETLRAGRWERVPDPENPRHLRGRSGESVLRLDRAPDQAAVRPVLSWPDEAEHRVLQSTALSRSVQLRVQRSHGAAACAPVLVLYDAFLWGDRAPARDIVFNLVRAGRIPPTHLVLIDQLDTASAGRAYADQVDFLADELVPWMRSEGLSAENCPVILAGASRRGLVSGLAALERPDVFTGAIALSGSFYWAPDGEAPEWLGRQIAAAPASAPRFHLAAGRLEYVVTSTNGGHVMLETNRNLAAVLAAHGYPVTLREFPGGHDVAGWRHALAEGLADLLGPE
ncbi:alpha/beta hydrolase-fold protein [Maricaulis parjimensis]|uniref:alpha/beta hydrolase-fold protein n=1 Tax=Maricaulis parjimensis TaxID=144023 RepID=UPI001939F308|nr:alpha/beta hydrolase-fold protein [Maricaulis parjimensis]